MNKFKNKHNAFWNVTVKHFRRFYFIDKSSLTKYTINLADNEITPSRSMSHKNVT